jgi:hypothetical protein
VESSAIREMPKEIKASIFEEMHEALHDAASYERCKPVDFRVTNKAAAKPKPAPSKTEGAAPGKRC